MAMEICFCGRKVQQNDNFCGNCGQCVRTFKCKFCGHRLDLIDNFCTQCGQQSLAGRISSLLYFKFPQFYTEIKSPNFAKKHLI